MKIKPNAAPVSAPRHGEAPVSKSKPAAPAQAARAPGWSSKSGDAKRTLISQATGSVLKAIGEQNPNHPLLEKFGEGLGKALGVVVTEALALSPKWNAPVLDANGQPVPRVEGADRIGSHDLLQRHQEVVGPKIAALVQKLPPGAIHDLLEGLGRGASEAPGDSYRLEAMVSDALKKL